MEILHILDKRYATKKFDSTRKISHDEIDMIETILQFSPSSTNMQPWHFIVASTDSGKSRIAKSMHGIYGFNESKVLDASVVVVFAAKTEITGAYLEHVLGKETSDARFTNNDAKDRSNSTRLLFSNMHKYERKDLQHWFDKQVYLNVGNFLLAVACMGIDAVPMEGFDSTIIDKEFDLHKKGFTSSLVVALGYHDESDYNSKLPKSRLTKAEIIERI